MTLYDSYINDSHFDGGNLLQTNTCVRYDVWRRSVTATLAPTPKTIQFDILFIVDETEDEKFIPDVAEKFIENIMEIFSPSQRRARVGLITMPQKEVIDYYISEKHQCLFFQKKSMPVAFLSSIDSFEALDRNLVSLEDFNIEGDKECIVQWVHIQSKASDSKRNFPEPSISPMTRTKSRIRRTDTEIKSTTI